MKTNLLKNLLSLRQCSRKSLLPFAAAFLILFAYSCGGDGTEKKTTSKDTVVNTVVEEKSNTAISDTGILTIASIRKLPDGKSVEVLFNERESIYSISTTDKDFAAKLKLFEESLVGQKPLKIVTASNKTGIESYEPLSGPALESFKTTTKTRIKATAPIRILDIVKIDSTIFNHVPPIVTTGCVAVIPNYATAVTIFNYCAAQSCNIANPPPVVVPCIPFQYVRDGCYARAHKMKWIIETKFNYCLQKVFSFANNGTDVLAVQANKWGGCCVTWWYHVAPLVQVQTPSGILAYVIDPGMFNQPVLLSVWLQAQANKTCSGRAKVTTYSIQPASAYTPANYQGTAFNTDPNYANTNQTLIAYRNLHTCP